MSRSRLQCDCFLSIVKCPASYENNYYLLYKEIGLPKSFISFKFYKIEYLSHLFEGTKTQVTEGWQLSDRGQSYSIPVGRQGPKHVICSFDHISYNPYIQVCKYGRRGVAMVIYHDLILLRQQSTALRRHNLQLVAVSAQ